MPQKIFFVLLVAFAAAAPFSAPECEHLIKTQSGPICGALQQDTGGVSYLGIPYAAPPIGPLRWKAPQPVSPWQEIRDASNYGPGCVQLHHNEDVPKIQSEDCLSVNVYTPPQSCGSSLPIVIWLHGGSFEEGGSSLFFYNGTYFASKHCIVVVSGNYRLGAFGGVLTSELEGNQGLLDQRAMIKWTKENGAAFGGNTDNIALWGQSAGAMSVGFHISSPKSNVLFHKAIMQSNFAAYDYKSRKQALGFGNAFKSALNCTNLLCMQNKTTEEIKRAHELAESKTSNIVKFVIEWRNLAVILPFTPFVNDPKIKVENGNFENDFYYQPLKAIETGNYNHNISILQGSNVGDAILFVGCAKKPMPPIEFRLGIQIIFGIHGHKANSLYACDEKIDAQPCLSEMFGDFLFRCPVRKAGLAASKYSNVYSYLFNYSLPFNIFGDKCCEHKPCHGVEIPLVMHALGPYALDRDSESVSANMQNLWAEFIRNGSPSPQWPALKAQNPLELEIEADGTLANIATADDKCNFWDSFTPFWDLPGKN